MNLIVGPQVPSHLTDRGEGRVCPPRPLAPTPSPLFFKGVLVAFFLEVVLALGLIAWL